MSRYKNVERAAYERGIEAASAWLREFLREGGRVSAGGGWDADLLVFRRAGSNEVMTCTVMLPHLIEWQRHFGEKGK